MLFQEAKVDQRFFQRGNTWQETVEGWAQDRDLFLGLNQSLQNLPKFQAAVLRMEPTRLLVLYRPKLPMAILGLPALGKTMDQADHISSRFYNTEFFFPLLHPKYQRLALAIFAADPNGGQKLIWRPSKETLIPPMEALTTETYLDFLRSLDADLARAFRQATPA